jgi:integrase/recombinase XerD
VNERLQPVDDDERIAISFWQKGHLCRGTIVSYLHWVRRFRKYCENRELIETEQLTSTGVERFLRAYSGSRLKGRRNSQNSRIVANNALHAWACALGAMGRRLPLWREKRAAALPALLQEYCRYRRAHNGVAERTLLRDVEIAGDLLTQLRHGMRPIEQATVKDLDAVVRKYAARVSRRTVADNCSSLRAFSDFSK